MKERRKYSRIHLIHYLTIFDFETNKLIGNLVDITPEGIMMISENPIAPGEVRHFRMNLPDDFLEETRSIEFDALSVWQNVDINPDLFAIGFNLSNIAPEDVKRIKNLIDEYRD